MEKKDTNYVNIVFSKENVISEFKRKSDGLTILSVRITKGTFKNYLFTIPKDWVKDSKFDDDNFYFGMKKDRKMTITKSEKKEDGTYEMIDKKEISASVLAKAMK